MGDTVGWAWDKVAEGIVKWVLGAVAYFVGGVVNFLLTSARPNVEAAWFSGADSPYATVRSVALALLLGFVFLGLIQGLLAGDIGGMIRRVALDLPIAILGMIATTIIVDRLLQLTDALSAEVLTHSGDQAVHFLSGDNPYRSDRAQAELGWRPVIEPRAAIERTVRWVLESETPGR